MVAEACRCSYVEYVVETCSVHNNAVVGSRRLKVRTRSRVMSPRAKMTRPGRQPSRQASNGRRWLRRTQKAPEGGHAWPRRWASHHRNRPDSWTTKNLPLHSGGSCARVRSSLLTAPHIQILQYLTRGRAESKACASAAADPVGRLCKILPLRENLKSTSARFTDAPALR